MVAGCAPGVLTIERSARFQSITGCPDAGAARALAPVARNAAAPRAPSARPSANSRTEKRVIGAPPCRAGRERGRLKGRPGMRCARERATGARPRARFGHERATEWLADRL